MTQTFEELSAENARLRAALTDCNGGLNSMAHKLVCMADLLQIDYKLSTDEIRKEVIARLAGVPRLPDHLRDETVIQAMATIIQTARFTELPSYDLAVRAFAMAVKEGVAA